MKTVIKDIVIAAVIAVVVIQFVRPVIVRESSMEPTLNENDYLFTFCQSYRFGEPEYGDIVVFESDLTTENGSEKLLIKRVIGLPGDTITVKDNSVYRNGTLIYEEYIKEQGVCPGDITVEVPDGHLFVMGDNRLVSLDSRYEEVGCVDIDDVKGKAVYRLFPFGERTKL